MQSYHLLTRTPTRNELLTFTMPDNILETRREAIHDRLRGVVEDLIREAEAEVDEGAVNPNTQRANDDSHNMEYAWENPMRDPAIHDDEEGEHT